MMDTSVFNTLVRDSDGDLCYISESGHKYILMEGMDFPNSSAAHRGTYDLIFIIDSALFLGSDFEGDGFVGLLFGAEFVRKTEWIKAIGEKVSVYEQKGASNDR